MPPKPPRFGSRISREVAVVVALCVLGALVRVWSFGRLGLVHFDEGIYALAGLWSLSPGGLAGIDPSVISYAPPGFPILVGLSFWFFGISDIAAILPSIIVGVMTIAVIAWIARRTFGPGAGAAAAALAALSGPHVSFSRMALTDVSFLGVWLAALGLGQRFLERPNFGGAVLFGGAVGLAQLFKYNGWISGVIVAASALVWLSWHPGEWRSRTTVATWGWGLFAAFIAAIVYYPWFRFVDGHGGYAALLAHQRGYLGGVSAWPGHLRQQLVQSEFLSGGPIWRSMAGALALVAMFVSTGDLQRGMRVRFTLLLAVAGMAALCLGVHPNWSGPFAWAVMMLCSRTGPETPTRQSLFVGWGLLSCLTPFYHPYARLWLPLEALGWLLIGGILVRARPAIDPASQTISRSSSDTHNWRPWFVMVVIPCLLITSAWWRRTTLLGPSDSLKLASQQIMNELPSDLRVIRIFARPPLAFYIALDGRVAVNRQPVLNAMLEQGEPGSWAVIDMGLLRQDGVSALELERFLTGWTIVSKVATTLNPPTLLDVDPSAARADRPDASAPIWLVRRSRVENIR